MVFILFFYPFFGLVLNGFSFSSVPHWHSLTDLFCLASPCHAFSRRSLVCSWRTPMLQTKLVCLECFVALCHKKQQKLLFLVIILWSLGVAKDWIDYLTNYQSFGCSTWNVQIEIHCFVCVKNNQVFIHYMALGYVNFLGFVT